MKIGERVGSAGTSLRKIRNKEKPKYSSHKTIIIIIYTHSVKIKGDR